MPGDRHFEEPKVPQGWPMVDWTYPEMILEQSKSPMKKHAEKRRFCWVHFSLCQSCPAAAELVL